MSYILTMPNGVTKTIKTPEDIAIAMSTISLIPPLCFSKRVVERMMPDGSIYFDSVISAHYRNDIIKVGTIDGEIPWFLNTKLLQGCGAGATSHALIDVTNSFKPLGRPWDHITAKYLTTTNVYSVVHMLADIDLSYIHIEARVENTSDLIIIVHKILQSRLNANIKLYVNPEVKLNYQRLAGEVSTIEDEPYCIQQSSYCTTSHA